MRNLFQKIKYKYDLIRLGDGIRGMCNMFLFIMQLMVQKKAAPKPKSLALRLHGQSVHVHLSGIHPELLMLHEIFIAKEYDFPGAHDVETIIDLGANIGLATIYFATKYPQARIVSVEADPYTCARLKKNTKQFKNVLPINAAVLDGKEKSISFFRHPVRHLASSLYRRTPQDIEIQVPTVTLDKLLGDGIDVLKFDIEGAEYALFKHFGEWHKINYISGETHADIIKKEERYDLCAMLEKHFNLTYTSASKPGRRVFYGRNKQTR